MNAAAPGTTTTQQIDFIHTRLRPGDVLQLQLFENEQRYPVKLIGYIPDKTILLTAPMSGQQLLLLREHQNLTLRAISGKGAIAFTSAVVKLYSTPVPYLHIAWPSSVHSVVVRASERASLELNGVLINTSVANAHQHPVSIVDLSQNGAAILSNEPIGKKEDLIELAFQVTTYNIALSPKLKGVIRSVAATPDKRVRYGIQFDELDVIDKLTLQSLVCQKIYDLQQ